MYTSYFGIISKETTLFRYLLLIVLVLTPILTTRAGAQTSGYTEAPQLAQLVESGQLPPIEERLPETPLVVEPHERIGQYGGDWFGNGSIYSHYVLRGIDALEP
jgi:hypothetical protein